jgi:glyoxylase-like metal-dependent hydrolase (beta-lactamase superfamily II)
MPDVRAPLLQDLGDDIVAIDTGMAGQRQLNSVYVLLGPEPCLVEAGPGADAPVVVAALEHLGIGQADLAHVVVTHVHIDHAGGGGALLARYPRATIWAHERGAPHLADPTRLIASTSRTYGAERMRALYGDTWPCPADRVRGVVDGDRIQMGGRAVVVLHTPGHASHHVALHDEATGALFTGEAIGSYLPWADCYRPALPPPEVDVEAALESIRRMRERKPTRLLTSHFGVVDDPDEGFSRSGERIRSWSEAVRACLRSQPDASPERVAHLLLDQARREFARDAPGTAFELTRYDALGSVGMNAAGLSRYWRKRWNAEGGAQES